MKSKKNVLAWVMMTVGIGFLAVAAAMALPYVDTGANAVIEAPRQQVSAQRADSAAVAAPPQAEQPAVVLLPDMPVAQAGANVAVAASTQDLAPLQVSTIVSPELPSAIEIPAIKVKAKVIAVGPGKKVGKSSVEWSSPGKGQVGWHNYSGRLGEAKNLVLNGHNNIQGAVFRKLYTLQAGDLITIASASYVRVYEVQEVLTLLERGVTYEQRVQNAQYIQPMNDDRLTLISCWPETSNTHRIIVIARPVSQNY